MKLPVGSRSVLYGAHCWFIHPVCLFLAWWSLYGFPWDPRLWVAFVVHDLGYWGLPNMDGPEGEEHVNWGGAVMEWWFGREWGDFTRAHSRFWAKQHNVPYSRLCTADKKAFLLDPWWLYLPRVVASGEIHEYLDQSMNGTTTSTIDPFDPGFMWGWERYRAWHRWLVPRYRSLVVKHLAGEPDTWTRARVFVDEES